MAAASSPWIISARQDLTWFWGGALVSLGAGALAATIPGLALPLFCLWLLCSDGPHFWATWTRSYFDPVERAEKRGVLLRSLLIFLPGFAAFGLSRAGVPGVWEAFLGVAALWGWHHFVRQDYGIWALYARHARLDANARRVDTAYLYGALWLVFLWFTVAHPLNAAELGLALPAWLDDVVGGALIAVSIGYAGVLATRFAAGQNILPGLFVLVPNVVLQTVGFYWIGLREPLIAGAGNLEQSFAVLGITNGVTHGFQYLGLVAFAARNRYPEGGVSLAAKISRSPWRGWMVYVALSVPYVFLNLYRNAAPGVTWGSPLVQGLSLSLYWGFLLHHYLVDQYIWRPHTDARVRADLGLA